MTTQEDLELAAAKSEHIAWELERIATAAEKIANGTLSMEAVVALIKLNCPRQISKEDIATVLRAMPQLKRFIKAKK